MTSKSTIKTAQQLLDRFFRDAEGRTNRQLDVYFTIEDLKLARDRAEPALEFLNSRGLLNTFGPDIAYLTDRGVQVVVEDQDIGQLSKEYRDFGVSSPIPAAPASSPAVPVPISGTHAATPPPPTPPSLGEPPPELPQLVHIDLNGQEFTVPLSSLCTIGRNDDNTIQIDDKRASKHHADIRFESNEFVLRDLDSANGTLLNGTYVAEPIVLKNEDEIVIGRTMLLFQRPEVLTEPPPPPSPDPVEEEQTLLTPNPGVTERPHPSLDPVLPPAPSAPSTPPSPEATLPPLSSGPPPIAQPDTSQFRVVRGRPDQIQPNSSPPMSAPASSPAVPLSNPSAPLSSPSAPISSPNTPLPPVAPMSSAPPSSLGPPNPADDLFDQAPVSSGPLFSDTPATGAASVPSPVLFDAGPRSSPAADDLFSTPTATAATDLFSPAAVPTSPARPHIKGGDDLFSEPEELATHHGAMTSNPPAEPSMEMELEPIAGAPELAQPSQYNDMLDVSAPADPLIPSTPSAWPPPDPADDIGTAKTLDSGISNPQFHKTLMSLRDEIARSDLPDRASLLQAIDLLENHPYVRVALKIISR